MLFYAVMTTNKTGGPFVLVSLKSQFYSCSLKLKWSLIIKAPFLSTRGRLRDVDRALRTFPAHGQCRL